MDLIASCRDKLSYFRIKDLKDVLCQLAVTKQGKKQDLINRILALLSDDSAIKFLPGGKKCVVDKDVIAKIIEDTYRKIHLSGATNLASVNPNLESNYSNSKAKTINTFKVNKRVCCPCGSSLITEYMVQCEDSTCQVWQHTSCVVLEKPEGAQLEVPAHFYCEVCRIKRADPFRVTKEHPLHPSLLPATSTSEDGTSDKQTTHRVFQLSRVNRDACQRADYDLQVWCILLNDHVPFRMHWPQFTELRINGYSVRATNRPGNQLLGANGRDDGVIITGCIQEGINEILFSKSDTRVFCFGIRIARCRTLQEVTSLIPKEGEGERFEDALSRICRCVGGGNVIDSNEGSDSDIEVVADLVTANLRCPLSGARIKTAGRFKPCLHMGCFDLTTFLELNQHSRKWQCPICMKNYSLENIIIDPYFNRITKMLEECEEDVDEIDIKTDGSWKAKGVKYKDLGQWHLADGTTFMSFTAVNLKPDALKSSKQDVLHMTSKDLNELCLNNKQDLVKPPLLDPCALSELEKHCQYTAFVSSSANGSNIDGGDSSIDQDGSYFDISVSNACELESALGLGITNNPNYRMFPGSVDKVVLSDSEEDRVPLTVTEPSFENTCVKNTTDFALCATEPGNCETYLGAPGVGTNRESCMVAFCNRQDFRPASFWPLITCSQMDLCTSTQTGPPEFLSGFRNGNIENVSIDAPRSEICWPSINGSISAMYGDGSSSLQKSDYLTSHPNPADNNLLLDNPLALDKDPSLQIFLPTQPQGASVLRNLEMQAGTSDVLEAGDWISLRLGSTELDHHKSSQGGLNPSQQLPKHSRADFSSNGSFVFGMDGKDGSNKIVTDVRRPNHSTRSVKPRLSLSIDVNFD